MISLLVGFCLISVSAGNCPANDSSNRRYQCSDFRASEGASRAVDTCARTDDGSVKLCGREGVSLEDCLSAGCCYNHTSSTCYLHSGAEKSEYRFFAVEKTYDSARRTCKANGMRMFCLNSDEGYQTARNRSCGEIWLRGKLTERTQFHLDAHWDIADSYGNLKIHFAQHEGHTESDFHSAFERLHLLDVDDQKIPSFNVGLGTCNEDIAINCFTGGDGKENRFKLLPSQNSYYLALEDKEEVNPFLCSQEYWKTHIYMYPQHVRSNQTYKYVLCGLRYSGDAETSKIKAVWTYISPNGSEAEVETINYKKTLTSGNYMTSLKANNPGKYICTYRFLEDDDEENMTQISAWAYHYNTDSYCNVSIDGESFGNENLVAVSKNYKMDINISVTCYGYPPPKWVSTYRREGNGSTFLKSNILNGANITIQNFAGNVPLSADYTLEIVLQPQSLMTQSLNSTVKLSKSPSSPECNVTVSDKGGKTKTQHQLVSDRNVNVSALTGETLVISASCSGYPTPEVGASQQILSEKFDSLYEDFQPLSNGSSFSWTIKDFAIEDWLTQLDRYTKVVTINVTSAGCEPLFITCNLTKVLILFDDTLDFPGNIINQESDGLLDVVLPCKGRGTGLLNKTTAVWKYNDNLLDVDSDLGNFLKFKYPEKSDADGTLLLNLTSAVVAGVYKCIVDNGAGQLQYSTRVESAFPPAVPSQVYIREIGDASVTGAVTVPSSWPFSNITKYTGYLYSDGALKEQITVKVTAPITETELIATFPLPAAERGRIQIGFSASNNNGNSKYSGIPLSEEMQIVPGAPKFSVQRIVKSRNSSAPIQSALNITYGKVPEVDAYQVRLYDKTNIRLLQSSKTFVTIENLEPESIYFLSIRGFKIVNGTTVYGPSSLRRSFVTAPKEIPKPTGFSGSPLEGDGITAAVLLTWNAPKVRMEGLISGYNLIYDKAEEKRRKRQALQTIDRRTLFIPYGAKAFVVRGLESGKRYSFSLTSFSNDFGASDPATATVETMRDDLCPRERNLPEYCPPRVTLDRKYMYIKFLTDDRPLKVDEECFTRVGNEYTGHTSHPDGICRMWPTEILEKYNVTDKDNSSHQYCRNWDGTDMKSPWCVREEDDEKVYCDHIPPCGYHNVNLTARNSTGTVYNSTSTVYDYREDYSDNHYRDDFICLPLGLSDSDRSIAIEIYIQRKFGIKDCYSERSESIKVNAPDRVRIVDRLWVRYLIVQGCMWSVVIAIWASLLLRKRYIVDREQIMASKKTLSTRLSLSAYS